jgi:proteic killer suppression protein
MIENLAIDIKAFTTSNKHQILIHIFVNFLFIHLSFIVDLMEIIFNDSELADLYEGKKVTNKLFRSNPQLVKQFVKVINWLRAINKIEDLYRINSLNYEKLLGDWAGYSSVRLNKKYRLIFKEIVSNEEPFEVLLIAVKEVSNHYQ